MRCPRASTRVSAQSETLGMHEDSTRESREPPLDARRNSGGLVGEGYEPEPNMHAGGESDGCVQPTTCSNDGGQPLAEGIEERQGAKENIELSPVLLTLSRINAGSG